MKVPRDLSGSDLVRALRIFGYETVRQTGSHIRLRSQYTGTEHLITIPNHNPIKLGTIQGILGDIAQYLKMTKPELIERLFG
ncbi:MAG TPA: type II toxin-antitoxin system HicA family toxin [Acidobacteriaceae bacterium]